ncbi:MAG: hypothetical protein WEC14_00650 [Chloroflexota bacterium]
MRRSTAALSTATILSLVLVSVLAGPASADDRAAQARAEQARIVAYWTPARVASAIPRDFIREPNGTFKPAAKPSNPGKPGGGGSGGNVTGASWNGGGVIKTASGKVLFRMGSSRYVCSASVVDDGSRTGSRILTAAHCAFDESTGLFATEWLFVPDYDSAPTFDCALNRFGCWTATALVVHDGYASAGGFTDEATYHDFAIAVVGVGTQGTQLDTIVGKFGIQYNGDGVGTDVKVGDKLYAFGYPAAGKYKGNDLVYCAGPIGTDVYNDDKTWSMGCDMTGGSSGGPWLADFSEGSGSGILSSLNSYGYSGIKNMYGPVFNTNTRDVVTEAFSRTSGNDIVGD